MTQPSCKDCRFYQPTDEYRIEPDGDSIWGMCRYNPPTIERSNIQKRSAPAAWPMVGYDDWCGKFEPNNEPNPPNVLEDYTLPWRAGPESDLISRTENALEREKNAQIEEAMDEQIRRSRHAMERNAQLIKQQLESAQEDAEPAEADNEEPEDSLSEFMDWQEKKLLELLQDDREAVEEYRKAFLKFIDEREEEEPAQTDWEADRIATHNERYAERARLAQHALRQRVGYQEIVAQVGMAMATLSFPVFLGIPICRPGEKFFHFHGELWEFLIRPPNQSGIWLVDTEGGFPPGPYQLRWENDRWYSDGELPKWPRA